MSTRYIIPDKVEIEVSDGKPRMLSNDEIDVSFVYAALSDRHQQTYVGCFEPQWPIRENAICTRGMMVLMDIALYFNCDASDNSKEEVKKMVDSMLNNVKRKI